MNTLVEKVVEQVPFDIFTDTTVRNLIQGTGDRRYSIVKRAIQSGEIIHLRRGLYVLAEKYRRKPNNLFEIAQMLYGPSYISFESALSFHGWIPEGVYAVTSASDKRSQEIETQLGIFSYTHIPSNNFYAGVQRVSSDNIFLIATPWRALTDYVYFHKKNWKGLKPVIENLRVDQKLFQNVDFRLLEELYNATRSVNVKRFIKSIKQELLA